MVKVNKIFGLNEYEQWAVIVLIVTVIAGVFFAASIVLAARNLDEPVGGLLVSLVIMVGGTALTSYLTVLGHLQRCREVGEKYESN